MFLNNEHIGVIEVLSDMDILSWLLFVTDGEVLRPAYTALNPDLGNQNWELNMPVGQLDTC